MLSDLAMLKNIYLICFIRTQSQIMLEYNTRADSGNEAEQAKSVIATCSITLIVDFRGSLKLLLKRRAENEFIGMSFFKFMKKIF